MFYHVFTQSMKECIHEQLMEYLTKHCHPLLSVFRLGFSCQTALIKIKEEMEKRIGRQQMYCCNSGGYIESI